MTGVGRPRRREWGYAAALATAAALGAGALLPAISLVPSAAPSPAFLGDAGVARLLSGSWPAAWGTTLQSPAQHEGLLAVRDLLAALAGVALAMACATVAALALSRGAARRRDVAVHAAVGATPSRVIRGTVAQVSVFALLTSVAGIVLGLAGLSVLAASRPVLVREWVRIHTGPAELLLSAGAPALTLLLLTPVPALGAATWRLTRSLAVGARATATPGEGFLRHALAVSQLAAALSLLIGAGLLLRGNAVGVTSRAGVVSLSGRRLTEQTSGTTTTPSGSARRYLPGSSELRVNGEPRTRLYEVRPGAGPSDTPDSRAAFYSGALSRLAALPGVAAVGAGSGGAWLGEGPEAMVQFTCPRCGNGGVPTPVVAKVVRHALVTPGALAMFGAPLVRGRVLEPAEVSGSAPVAVINRAFERLFQGMTDPIGQSVRVEAGGEWHRIVGVVEDLPVVGPGAGMARGSGGAGAVPGGGAAPPILYLPLLRYPPRVATVLVGGGAAGEAVARAIEQAGAARVEPRGTLDGTRARLAAVVRWTGGAALAFGAVALVLAIHGVAAVALDEVRRRRRELAVRAALGAPPWRLVALVLGRGLRRVAAGAAWASGGAILVAWLLERLSRVLPLFDLGVYAGSLAVVALAALLAGVQAAVAATAVEPRAALAEE